MSKHNGKPTCSYGAGTRRCGAVAVYVAISMAFVLGFAALAVDIGMLYATQAELQRTADAAALAATWELLDEDRLKGGSYQEYVFDATRECAVNTAAANPALRASPVVDPFEDVQIGYVSDLTGGNMTFDNPSLANATTLCVRRDAGRGGSIALYFATFLGAGSRDLRAEAMAAFADSIVGYEVTSTSGNAQLLPFALHVDSWDGLKSGTVTTGDEYSYDPETGAVSPGGDGILELNLYPGAGAEQLPPGNFGTVDIGSASNSTDDIARQILHGVSAADLAYFGGALIIGNEGLDLTGDTGLSASVRDELEAIKGQGRAIPIFSDVYGPGDNATFNVVTFVGIRIMNVKLTGPMNKKELIIQPAVVVDGAAIADSGPGASCYVYRPVQLVR